MNKRPLGDTGILVGEMGFGAWQIGGGAWGDIDQSTGVSMVNRFLDLGGNFIDTAPGYGGGVSEELLGKALNGQRDQAVICTKFGHHADGSTNYNADKLRESLEGSLRRLQTDFVDVLLMHNPPFELYDGTKSPHYEILETLVAEGKIRCYGVSVDWSPEMRTALNTTKSKAVEVLFNVFHQDPLALFPQASKQGAGLIVKVPLDSGWLSGKYNSNSSFNDVRSRWTYEQIKRRADLIEKLERLLPQGISIRDAALSYILAQPEVSTIIPGARSIDQVEQNCSLGNSLLSDSVVNEIYEFWKKEIELEPLPW